MDWKLFEALSQAAGAPGFEGNVSQIMDSYITQYTEEKIEDNLGGVFGVLRGDPAGPRVMVAGHMDEVAFMVTRITEDGFLKFRPLGGWWDQVLLAQRVEIVTRSGQGVPGVIGSVPPHLLSKKAREQLVSMDEMFIDIGARNAEEVAAFGIRPGDTAVPVCPFIEMAGGRRIMTKAWDNRFGCGLAIELLRSLHKEEHPNLLFSGATVQEEVGLRGAAAAANQIRPDVFFAVDAGPAGDIPGVREGFGELGGGVLIRIMDGSMITLPAMRDFLLDTAESEGIPYQVYVSPGGTDAGRVHQTGTGIPSAAIGICARYIHSHATIADKEDLEAARAFLLALVKRLDRSTLELIQRR